MPEYFGLLTQYAYQVPYYLAWLAGMVLCLVRWQKHPMVSLLALLAFTLFFVQSLIGTAVWWWLIVQRQQAAWSESQFSLYLALQGGIRTAVSTAGYVLLLVALFGWRGSRHMPTTRGKPLPEVAPDLGTAPEDAIREGRSQV